jgi:uncharacterized membrane protein YczE
MKRVNRFVDALKPDFGPLQYVNYLSGCFLFSYGAGCFIASNLGTDPLDVFSLGLLRHLPITVGIAQGGFAAACLGIWALWNRRIPIVSPFVTFFLCGSLIDLWMYTHAAQRLGLGPSGLLLTGVSLCAYGSSLIIMSGIGIRAMDLVAITATYKCGLPFWLCKGVAEVFLLVSGWWLGGPVGIGTIVFLVFVGWMIQPVMWANRKLLGIQNFGLPPLEQTN